MRKASLLLFATALAAVACGPSKALRLFNEKDFRTSVDGKEVALYTLSNGGVTMQVTNFGARVASLFTRDRDGRYESIVVGHDNIRDYITPPGERFLGACVGPVANRIGGARFTVDGTEYRTPQNDNAVNTLHGGYIGVDNLVWDVADVCDTAIVLHLLHPDGLEGYPGNLDMTMTYALDSEGSFHVDYSATSQFWMCNRVTNACYKMYNYMAPVARCAADAFEQEQMYGAVPELDEKVARLVQKGRLRKARRLMTRHTVRTAMDQFAAWTKLEELLLVKFIDGNVKAQGEDGEFLHTEYSEGIPAGLTQPGYTEFWKEAVANGPHGKVLEAR